MSDPAQHRGHILALAITVSACLAFAFWPGPGTAAGVPREARPRAMSASRPVRLALTVGLMPWIGAPALRLSRPAARPAATDGSPR